MWIKMQQKLEPSFFKVPGDGGSQIEAKIDKPNRVSRLCVQKTDYYFTLWLNGWDLLPKAIDCWTDNMLLRYDPKTHKTFNNDGVDIRVPGFGMLQIITIYRFIEKIVLSIL